MELEPAYCRFTGYPAQGCQETVHAFHGLEEPRIASIPVVEPAMTALLPQLEVASVARFPYGSREVNGLLNRHHGRRPWRALPVTAACRPIRDGVVRANMPGRFPRNS